MPLQMFNLHIKHYIKLKLMRNGYIEVGRIVPYSILFLAIYKLHVVYLPNKPHMVFIHLAEYYTYFIFFTFADLFSYSLFEGLLLYKYIELKCIYFAYNYSCTSICVVIYGFFKTKISFKVHAYVVFVYTPIICTFLLYRVLCALTLVFSSVDCRFNLYSLVVFRVNTVTCTLSRVTIFFIKSVDFILNSVLVWVVYSMVIMYTSKLVLISYYCLFDISIRNISLFPSPICIYFFIFEHVRCLYLLCGYSIFNLIFTLFTLLLYLIIYPCTLNKNGISFFLKKKLEIYFKVKSFMIYKYFVKHDWVLPNYTVWFYNIVPIYVICVLGITQHANVSLCFLILKYAPYLVYSNITLVYQQPLSFYYVTKLLFLVQSHTTLLLNYTVDYIFTSYCMGLVYCTVSYINFYYIKPNGLVILKLHILSSFYLEKRIVSLIKLVQSLFFKISNALLNDINSDLYVNKLLTYVRDFYLINAIAGALTIILDLARIVDNYIRSYTYWVIIIIYTLFDWYSFPVYDAIGLILLKTSALFLNMYNIGIGVNCMFIVFIGFISPALLYINFDKIYLFFLDKDVDVNIPNERYIWLIMVFLYTYLIVKLFCILQYNGYLVVWYFFNEPIWCLIIHKNCFLFSLLKTTLAFVLFIVPVIRFYIDLYVYLSINLNYPLLYKTNPGVVVCRRIYGDIKNNLHLVPKHRYARHIAEKFKYINFLEPYKPVLDIFIANNIIVFTNIFKIVDYTIYTATAFYISTKTLPPLTHILIFLIKLIFTQNTIYMDSILCCITTPVTLIAGQLKGTWLSSHITLFVLLYCTMFRLNVFIYILHFYGYVRYYWYKLIIKLTLTSFFKKLYFSFSWVFTLVLPTLVFFLYLNTCYFINKSGSYATLFSLMHLKFIFTVPIIVVSYYTVILVGAYLIILVYTLFRLYLYTYDYLLDNSSTIIRKLDYLTYNLLLLLFSTLLLFLAAINFLTPHHLLTCNFILPITKIMLIYSSIPKSSYFWLLYSNLVLTNILLLRLVYFLQKNLGLFNCVLRLFIPLDNYLFTVFNKITGVFGFVINHDFTYLDK